MDAAALLALFRAEVRDEVTPYLWSDAEIYSYIDDAQKMFCRLQGGIADASSALTRISVAAGDVFAPISPLILKLRQARRTADSRPLELLNFEDTEAMCAAPRLDNIPGPVQALVLGMETNRVRLVAIPTEAQTIDLIVYRLPLLAITSSSQVLEIDEQHHRALGYWMKHLAHQKQDAETYDRGRAIEFRDEFLTYCDLAKAERSRREHTYRTVAYGGY